MSQTKALAAKILGMLLAAPLGQAGAAAAATFLAGVSAGSLYVIDAGGPTPLLHGPFLAATFAQVQEIEKLRDAPSLLVRTPTQVHRVDLSNPLAPAVAATLTPPFVPQAIIPAGPQGYSLLTGAGGELAVVDNRTLAIRRTFKTPDVRHEGVLSPDGRLLVTFRLGGPDMAGFYSAFDPESGPGSETELLAVHPSWNTPFALFSPDGRTLALVQNIYFFDLTFGPAYNSPMIDIYERTGPAQLSARNFLFMGVDRIFGHAYSRDGKKLYLPQSSGFDPEVNDHNRIRILEAAGPGQLAHGQTVSLGEEIPGFAYLARGAGGRTLYATTTELDPQSNVTPRLHIYDTATGSLATHLLPRELGQLEVFETAAALFADGFETGNSAAWDGEFP